MRITFPPDLDHQGQSQTKITKWVTFDPPSEGQRSAVVETALSIAGVDAVRYCRGGPGYVRCQRLLHIGGSGAAPFYGLKSLQSCTLFAMQKSSDPGTPRGFDEASSAEQGDLFLHIIEMGCTDVCLLALTGPLTGRVVIGNSDGYRGPNVSSAQDFLAWYERWLDHMARGRDNRALELTSPQLRSHPNRHRLAPKI
ncbi:SMI1/KNR4 family protein [Streptomyces sp. CB01373]|uniref:SMI1/KNR4 family protein n=1 Tax=Streptomyces sp. CB01373 TaxID=2020325 RepID=UPI0018FEA442|nr:SMI1/KNR4 family protein [Streptomyces sp. CB01373]